MDPKLPHIISWKPFFILCYPGYSIFFFYYLSSWFYFVEFLLPGFFKFFFFISCMLRLVFCWLPLSSACQIVVVAFCWLYYPQDIFIVHICFFTITTNRKYLFRFFKTPTQPFLSICCGCAHVITALFTRGTAATAPQQTLRSIRRWPPD